MEVTSWKLMDGAECLLSMDGGYEATLPPAADNHTWVRVPSPATDYTATPDGDGGYTVAPNPYDVVPARAAKVAELRVHREMAWETVTTGKGVFDFGRVTGTTSGKDNIKDALDTAQILVDQGATPPATIQWRLHDNTEISVTLEDLQNAMTAGTLKKQAAYATSWTLEAQVNAATTQEELDAITWPTS